uniref:LIM zinc-binding domain-containing protein n=1 Tax=Meleagris gallopavo TaxID=9103 RepID=A0A803YL04_MELGA
LLSLRPEKPALCAGCGGKISDRYYLLAVDKQWHLRCLKCCECKLALESELTCFAKDGSPRCLSKEKLLLQPPSLCRAPRCKHFG